MRTVDSPLMISVTNPIVSGPVRSSTTTALRYRTTHCGPIPRTGKIIHATGPDHDQHGEDEVSEREDQREEHGRDHQEAVDEEREEVVRVTACPHHALEGGDEGEVSVAGQDVHRHVVHCVDDVPGKPESDRDGGNRDEGADDCTDELLAVPATIAAAIAQIIAAKTIASTAQFQNDHSSTAAAHRVLEVSNRMFDARTKSPPVVARAMPRPAFSKLTQTRSPTLQS